ncbi:amino acid ABC transporter ATP-binding protein [Peptostreptococcus anaerobius]|jgi:polar amino acid transport system ATP-binding protein|uniref:amino acid ABC transporter ATP-binding protein n=1 Tax=Peptostreptococcus anaerobius TaxID=1261 RepID=UPI001899EE6B|nr:amino acid ABC transporter ATP-binding protein [Peptostreptococcus anaerobius]MDU3828498.1 amino acid ABC transporter ATP-binding protein [Peptostreptococcus sp.]MDB8849966.1 amino acid ABC transporter ATP-binding protein [Peptostreptococcus anaerobius]MDB8852466.1 amino acid ABC transporter ATP-binding protein [Peptostreptococcus anaerobius]MDB8853698.1 amino acid ABC transporter ATP-binding protein [Peptostreptococcus anaerobius]MDB8855526.1 amino acid ABC transporter ATP-binding protein 
MLKVVDLKKSFNNLEVLKGISFEIEKGEIGVVLGKSGAGKTTLIRCINGLESFDSGSIIVDDTEIKNSADFSKLRGQIGMVFQNFNLFPHLTILENITEAPIRVFKKSRSEAEKIALELLDMVDLSDKKDMYPYQLSGGQQQRVAIARSCALNPKVLCFDEPTSALDQENIGNVKTIIDKFKNLGMAILIITHDIQFADTVADKIIYIEEGHLVEK